MIEYIKNIIPRIQKYSKGLDKIEVFVDKKEPWIFIDDDGNQHQYIFMRDKRLIMSYNGSVQTGTWELLPTNQLLINRVTDEILLDHLFIENALLVLKKSGTNDIPFVLINKDDIPDFDVEKYLEKYESEKERKEVPFDEQKYRILSSGEISGPIFYVKKLIETVDGKILSGTYKTTKSLHQEYVTIENNRITRVFYKFQYKYNYQFFTIEQKELVEPSKGDKIVSYPGLKLPSFKNVWISGTDDDRFYIKCNEAGVIINVMDVLLRNGILFIVGLFLFLASIAILSNT